MRFNKSLLRDNISPLGLRLLMILNDWERSDANLRQITSEFKFRKYYDQISKNQIKNALDSLVELGHVKIVEYMGNVQHYILDVYYSK